MLQREKLSQPIDRLIAAFDVGRRAPPVTLSLLSQFDRAGLTRVLIPALSGDAAHCSRFN